MPVQKLNKEAIESWPEIFEEVTLKVVPIQYLSSVHVKFKDNRVWRIDVGPRLRDEVWQTVEKNIKELINNYKTHIDSIDFKLDTDKIKKDITRQTNKFLKRRLK